VEELVNYFAVHRTMINSDRLIASYNPCRWLISP